MTATVDPATGELFDGTAYTVAFPKVDGHDVDDLVLRIGGSIKLNRNDADHAAFIDSLKLGGYATLQVFAAVIGKNDSYRPAENGHPQTVVHNVTLRIETVNPA